MQNGNNPYGRIHIKYDSVPDNSGALGAVKMTRAEKINLVLTTGILGFCILAFHYLGEYFVKVITKTPIMDYYNTSDAIFNIVQILYSFVCILVPFGIGLLFLKRIQKKRDFLPLQKPNSGKLFWLSLGIGFLALVVSNYITTFFVFGAEKIGFYFETGESPAPDSLSGFMWQVLSTALVPALVEEFAVRGVVMQSLRKFGDAFAIVMSAIIFALLHGNMVQAPFALLLGCVIGWLVIATDSMWTGIAIHFMNNLYATTMNALTANISQKAYIPIFLAINAAGIIIGIICLLRVKDNYSHKLKLQSPGGNNRQGKTAYRVRAFLYGIISAPMATAFVILIIDIVKRVHHIGG